MFFQDWRRVRAGASSSTVQRAHGPLSRSRPLGGRWKCNLDAALFHDLSTICLGMVLRMNDC